MSFHTLLYLFNTNLIVVLVYRGRTDSSRASVLLDGWLAPSAERREIGERWVVVIVSIPQWIVGELCGTTGDRVPLTGAGIDTYDIVVRKLDETQKRELLANLPMLTPFLTPSAIMSLMKLMLLVVELDQYYHKG